MAGRKYYKGKFRPLHPEKYKGDPTNIIYRSSWEIQVMKWLDSHPGVLKWASEELIIPYISPVDKKMHRYFPDFFVVINENGVEKHYIVEVKPKNQTKPPKATTKKSVYSKKYLAEAETFLVNNAKFEAANVFCEKRGWKFLILTEDNIKKI